MRTLKELGPFLGVFLTIALCEVGGVLLPNSGLSEPGVRVALAAIALAACAVGTRDLLRGHLRSQAPLHAANDLARRMHLPADQETLLGLTLEHAAALSGAQDGWLWAVEPNGDLVVARTLGEPRGMEKSWPRLRAGGGPLDAVLRSRYPIWLSTAAVPYPISLMVSGQQAEEHTGMVLVAPIRVGERVLGLISLCFPDRTAPVEGVDAAVHVIAAQAGIAVANARIYEELLRESRTDALTGLGSRREFDHVLRRELARSQRNGQPVSLAMIDVDRFKQINDRWGHVMGDRVLQAVARVIRDVRGCDLAARYGGDEFVVLLPETTGAQAECVVRRIRERLERLNEDRFFPFRVDLSIGVREATGGADLLAEADAAMYAEKRRNRRRATSGEETDTELERAAG